MLELYRRNIWTDAKSVNAISAGCLSKNSKMVMAGCKFMLDIDLDKEDLSEDESDQENKKIEIKRQIGSQMPKKKKDELRKMLKLLERKQKRKQRKTFQKKFLPIDLIYDPQGFTEKLFAKLIKGKGKKKELKGEAAMLALNLVAKMIGRHKLIIPEYFAYSNHAIKSKNKNIARVLASIAEACHENLQRDDVKDIAGTIIDNMVSEHCTPESITMGLNTIREICLRMSHILNEEQLAYLVQFREYKNRYVCNAARSIVNAYRDINPMLLPKKLRGLDKSDDEEGVTDDKGKAAGLELLQNEEGKTILTEKILDSNDLKRIKLLKLRKTAKAMGAMKQRREVLDVVREKINELREKYMANDEDDEEEGDKIGGKRNSPESDEEENEEDENENDESENENENEEDENISENDEDENENNENENESEEELNKSEEDKESNNDEESINEELEKYLDDEIEPSKEDIIENYNKEHGDLREMNDDELLAEFDDEDESDSNVDVNANQGFVTVDTINTFRKSKKERIKEALAQQVKQKHKRRDKPKSGSTSNLKKLKNKPYMMVLPKKRNEVLRAKYKSIKERIKEMENKRKKIRQGKLKVNRKIYIKA